MNRQLGGRGKKAPVTKKPYRLAESIGDIAKKISDRYESLSIGDKNEASKLLDELENFYKIVESKNPLD